LIDRDPLGWGEFRADHLHRGLRDFYLAHLVEKMNHRALVNLHDGDLNLVLMVVMKVFLNQSVPSDQKNQQNLVVKKVDRKMDDRNYSVYLNYRDALPCTHSLITIEI
jgi:hypothetical protein